MENNIKIKLDEYYDNLRLLRIYYHAIGLLNFDLETIAPKDAKENEGDTINYFSNEAFKISNSDKMKELIVFLHDNVDKLEPLDQILVNKKYNSYLKMKNITPEFDERMSKIYMESSLAWHTAKENKDFNLFKDSFKKVVEIQKEAINLRENKLPNMYDNMLDDCEEGILSDTLDKFFNELKEGLIELINKIKNSKHQIRDDFLDRKVPVYKQEMFSKYLLELNGYDLNKGVLSTTEHPFTSNIVQNDARVTTHYYENMVLSNIYSIIHEVGHAIFMQNEPEDDHKHFINDYVTNGMHESVSRFYENVVGRSKEYVHLIYPKFIEIFDEFKDVSEDELYEAINIVKPSLIRTEADEVTYGLHIVIRYEMEKMITEGKLQIEDAPAMWNKLYKHYLGVTPENDSQGILQDVHWLGGFGYFPSYAIGNSYNIMYLRKMKKEIDFENSILKGDFVTINKWMRENVFIHANRLTPKEWINELAGEDLTPKYFLEYLNNKYSKIYRF